MRPIRSLELEALEGRLLLTASKAHHAVAHPAHAVVMVPLVLDGTLTVNQKKAIANQDDQGNATVSIPVTGTLPGLGAVRGFWNESQDSYGDYMGPDTIQLRDSKGSFTIVFNDPPMVQGHKTVPTTVPIAQRVHVGTGAYVHVVENGTIVLNTNAARTVVQSLTLNTPAP